MNENTTNSTSDAASKPKGVRQWAFHYNPTDNKAVAVLRCWLRVFLIIINEFSETSIPLRASALTYTIVLSMVPILAMSTALLKGLGHDNQLRVVAYKYIDQLEPEPSKQVITDKANENIQEPDTAPFQPQQKKTTQSVTTHLRSAVDTIFNYVDRTNFAALGAFGIAGLLITVILVLSTVEDAMNAIWHTHRGRSIFRKIMDYLALLVLLPVSINIALAGDAIIASPTMLAQIHTFIPSEWAIRMILKLLPFLFVILSLMVMYLFFPNVRVKTYAAFSGAIFAALFWFLAQKAYIILQLGVSKYNAIYGSFATVPLFLIWVHIGWTFILLGASLAYAIQNRNLYHLPGTAISPQRNLQLAFDILNTLYENFSQKKKTSFDELVKANKRNLPGDIHAIIKTLVKGGLVLPIQNNNHSYVPATPSEKIEAREIVQLILGRELIPTMGGEFSDKVIRAAEDAILPEEFPPVAPVETTDKNEGIEDFGTNEKTL